MPSDTDSVQIFRGRDTKNTLVIASHWAQPLFGLDPIDHLFLDVANRSIAEGPGSRRKTAAPIHAGELVSGSFLDYLGAKLRVTCESELCTRSRVRLRLFDRLFAGAQKSAMGQ
jgi:hypothetical protein